MLLCLHPVRGQESGSAILVGSGGLDPAPTSTWEDSTFEERSTLVFSVRNSESSTRTLESFQGPLTPGLSVGLQRSQPGFFRRRHLSIQSEAYRFRGGDLESWSDDPLVEGSARGSGTPAPDDASSLVWGSGRRSNGVEGMARSEGLEVRSRWEEGRTVEGGTRGAGAIHLGIGPWMTSLRTEDGAQHVLSSGWQEGALGFWAATNDRFRPAFLVRVDSSPCGSGLHGSARWISNGFRHSALPAGWTGSAAFDLTGRLAFERRGGTSLRIQIVSDSSDRIRSRAISATRARFLSAVEMGLTGTVTREPDGVWSSARWKISRPSGVLRPWMEHSWSDSGSAAWYGSTAGIAWGAPSRSLRARFDWDWATSSGSALVSQEVAGNLQGYRLGFRIEAGQNLVNRSVRGQGTLTCDW